MKRLRADQQRQLLLDLPFVKFSFMGLITIEK
jgi:hypothetical protein